MRSCWIFVISDDKIDKNSRGLMVKVAQQLLEIKSFMTPSLLSQIYYFPENRVVCHLKEITFLKRKKKLQGLLPRE